jgi:hypothetical protein
VNTQSADGHWLADPTGRHQYRYWDGEHWTPHVASNGVQSIDDAGQALPNGRRLNPLALASLILSILVIGGIGSILAVTFGHQARRQIRDSHCTEKGSGLALAGLIIGYTVITILIVGVLVVISTGFDS